MAKTMNQKHLEMMNDPEYARHYQDRPYPGGSSQAYGHYPIGYCPYGVWQTIAKPQKPEKVRPSNGQ
mgnify:CR=1 FL=1